MNSPSQRASNAKLWYDFRYEPEQAVEQTFELPVLAVDAYMD